MTPVRTLQAPEAWNMLIVLGIATAYALAGFFIKDRVKLAAYRVLDARELPVLFRRARRLVASSA
jgi:hypothetical protein